MFVFDASKLRGALAPASQVQMDEVQERLIRDITAIVAPRLGLDPIPCRGLWLQAVKQWQMAHATPATAISSMTPEDRLVAATEIKDHFRALAGAMLVDPSTKGALDAALESAFFVYRTKYNKRY
jgi:hypothetical protein